MDALRSGMPQHLRTFVEPQVEQLSLTMKPIRCGLYGRLPDALGEGFLWTVPLGDDCLVSMHSLRLKKPLVLEERPTDFSCIFSGSRATFLSLPGAKASSTAEMENLAAFSQTGGTTRCLMQANVLYESTSITYTPDYFDRLAKAFPRDFKGANEMMRSFDPRTLPLRRGSSCARSRRSAQRCPAPRLISTPRRSRRCPRSWRAPTQPNQECSRQTTPSSSKPKPSYRRVSPSPSPPSPSQPSCT